MLGGYWTPSNNRMRSDATLNCRYPMRDLLPFFNHNASAQHIPFS